MRNDGDLHFIAKAAIVLGVIALFAVVINWQSGGQLFSLIERYASGESDSAPYRAPQADPRPVDEGEPTDEQIRDAIGNSWDCYFDPTMNNDWHDDVICRNGFESLRPILLPDAGFVTEAEMTEAGNVYEAELNAGR